MTVSNNTTGRTTVHVDDGFHRVLVIGSTLGGALALPYLAGGAIGVTFAGGAFAITESMLAVIGGIGAGKSTDWLLKLLD